ncbi:PAS domain S-box protein [Rhodocytophaga aerolata]|uniref:PAS domain S-box protein n=1 Tax=Rhodocytophaga aerolata TaxID=455078 RepID=A0ABT8RGP4_9BACT|nr:PAS domain S-box protein [Rhodocytophaga aerolata]MDO1451260.1 PAS domain S-box protein [Rhodocytophaga aerolata]
MLKSLSNIVVLKLHIALLAFLILVSLLVPEGVKSWMYVEKISLLVSLILSFSFFRIVRIDFIIPLYQGTQLAEQLSEGRRVQVEKTTVRGTLGFHLQQLASYQSKVTLFVEAVGRGEFETELPFLNMESGLNKALANMKYKLLELSGEEKKRNWQISGAAQIGDILRKNQNLAIEEVSLKFLQSIIDYLGLNQGGVFIIQEDPKGERLIELSACFAYNKKKYVEKKIEWGKGLVGQCILEGEPIYITQVPDNYLQITSGLGQANPRNLLLIPIKYNKQIFGVLEVAGFKKLQDFEIEFLTNVCESFGAVISNLKSITHTKELLEHSQQMAEELKRKEEVLQSNTHQLIATQQELNLRLKQIEQEANLTKSIVDAINKTNASIELDLEGNILSANEMYLSLMEYSSDEIIGKKEKVLVATDEIDSQRYDMMWESLKEGAFNSGEFKRISKKGKELWLSGSYSPILDVEGKATKILQLAQFTTEQKEKELEATSKINALNQSVLSMEVNCAGIIISSNALLQKELGYKRIELANKSFFDILYSSVKNSQEQTEIWDTIKKEKFLVKVLSFLSKDGVERIFICNFSPIKNLAGEISKFLVIMIDFSKQYQLQKLSDQLLIAERRKKAVLQLKSMTSGIFSKHFVETYFEVQAQYESAKISYLVSKKEYMPILMIDKDGKIVMLNSAAAIVLGIEMDSTLGKEIYELFYFSDIKELEALKERVQKPGFCQLMLKMKDYADKIIKLNIWLAPDFIEPDAYNNLLFLILDVEIPED